jgi:hypothetical protein
VRTQNTKVEVTDESSLQLSLMASGGSKPKDKGYYLRAILRRKGVEVRILNVQICGS